MHKQWIEAEKVRLLAEAEVKRAEIIRKIDGTEFLSDADRKLLKSTLNDISDKMQEVSELCVVFCIMNNHKKDDGFTMSFTDIWNFVCGLKLCSYAGMLRMANEGIHAYLDSEPMEFDGDIIITDPCYIVRAEHHGTIPITDDDWDACNCGFNMEALGIYHYMTRDTIYGDWGCTAYNLDTKQKIGHFCADAGLVSVIALDEVLKHNPDFDYHKAQAWTTALIPDFKGLVQFVVERKEGIYEDTTEFHKAGDKWVDFELHVVGHGINKKTGEPINFYSTQTSL